MLLGQDLQRRAASVKRDQRETCTVAGARHIQGQPSLVRMAATSVGTIRDDAGFLRTHKAPGATLC